MNTVFLDTHVMVWLYANNIENFPEIAKALIESNELLISPMVMLEIQFLKEIGRINSSPNEIMNDLQAKIGVQIDDLSFEIAARRATEINWTRDPFDRLIVASSLARSYPLITKDAVILKNLSLAIWDKPKSLVQIMA